MEAPAVAFVAFDVASVAAYPPIGGPGDNPAHLAPESPICCTSELQEAAAAAWD